MPRVPLVHLCLVLQVLTGDGVKENYSILSSNFSPSLVKQIRLPSVAFSYTPQAAFFFAALNLLESPIARLSDNCSEAAPFNYNSSLPYFSQVIEPFLYIA